MSGLILKDLYGIKQTLKYYVVIFIVTIIVSPFTNVSIYLLMYATLVGVIMTIQSITNDEQSNWNKYVVTLPFPRSYIALSKYILSAIGVALPYSFVYIGSIISPTLKESLSTDMILGGMAGMISWLLILIPLSFQYGTAKSRIMILAVVYVPIIVALLISQIGITIDYVGLLEKYAYLIPIILIIATVVSILVSIRICEKKDL